MLNLVKELCALPGVASFEDEVRDFLKIRATGLADEVRVDTMGNLIVFKRGRKPAGRKLALCAHMDEVGLLVRYITEEGYLKFSTIGAVDRRVLIGKPVQVGRRALPGVIGLKAYHLVSEEEEKLLPKLDDYYIDIGARSRAEAESMVSLGECAVFESDCAEFGNGMLKARALDSRAGCAALLKLLEEELPTDCTFIFSVQKAVGHRGAFGAAFSVKPEIALVLDAIPAGDLPGIEEPLRCSVPGHGPVIPFLDRGGAADRALFERLRTLSEENGISWQTARFPAAGNGEGAVVQGSRAGVRTAALALAVRYLYTPSGVIAVRDLEQILKLTRLFIDDVAGCI